MRTETKIGLLFNAIGLTVGRLFIFPDFISGFLSGIFLGSGLFLLVVGLLPEKQYNKLLYRKWLASRSS